MKIFQNTGRKQKQRLTSREFLMNNDTERIYFRKETLRGFNLFQKGRSAKGAGEKFG